MERKYSCIGKLTVVWMLTLPQLIFKIECNSVKTPAGFFTKTEKISLKVT